MSGFFKKLRLRFKEYRALLKGYREWRVLLSNKSVVPKKHSTHRFLIVPADPWSVTGSRGDEAMILSIIEQITAKYPEVDIAVITADENGSKAARALKLMPLEAWRGPLLLSCIYQAVEQFDPNTAVIIGADVMDGYYSAQITLILVATADLLARRGCCTSIIGFSFNSLPVRSLKRAFEGLSTQVRVNVRDPISLERFARFAPIKARLVCDAAYMLKPQTNFPEYQKTLDWVNKQHKAGKIVLGVNLHPMLIKKIKDKQLVELISLLADALARLGASRPTSFLLLPHDFRPGFGDNRCLEPLAEKLYPHLHNRILYLEAERTAAELKALAGLVDGMISSRLHLAVATLGMGKPVCVFSYQDKFQGLLRCFSLPEWLMMPALNDSNSAELLARFEQFVDELPALRNLVVEKLPAVLELSKLNMDM